MIHMSIMSIASLLSTVSFAAADLGGSNGQDAVTHLDELEQDIANHTGLTTSEVDDRITYVSEVSGADKTVIAEAIDQDAINGTLGDVTDDDATQQDDLNPEGDDTFDDLLGDDDSDSDEDIIDAIENEDSDEAANGQDDADL